MPTNLTAEAKKKWNEASLARKPQEKLEKLQEFLSLIPKHKGTSRLCAQVKRQIATLRRQIEESHKRRVGRGGPRLFIEKEGAAQIVILGPTKVGRSSLLALVTNAKVEVSDYPYTTREPVPGMLQHEDLQFQLVEAPALVKGSTEGEAWGLHTLGLARNADGLILMVDLSQNPCEQLSLILSELEKARILTQKPRARLEIERKHVGAGLRIILFGRLADCTMQDVEALLKDYRIQDAIVKIQGEVTLDDVEDAIFESTIYRPAIILANKADTAEATKNLNKLKAFLGNKYTLLTVSCKSPFGFEKLGAELFRTLDIIRVYTKDLSEKEHSPKPFILKRGATIADLARLIHTDFYRRFSYAKVWAKHSEIGKGIKHVGPKKVGKSYILKDKDIVELHMK